MSEQRSPEWFAARGGMLSASMVHRIMSGTVGADTVREEIRLWRRTGKAPDYSNGAMQWGIDNEAQARASAEMESGLEFTQCGQLIHDEYAYFGASPDGLCIPKGVGLELKCPHNPKAHESYLVARNIPSMYRWQMHSAMWVTGYERWLFVSFDPRRLATGQRDHTILHWFPRSERAIAALEKRVPWFWGTV